MIRTATKIKNCVAFLVTEREYPNDPICWTMLLFVSFKIASNLSTRMWTKRASSCWLVDDVSPWFIFGQRPFWQKLRLYLLCNHYPWPDTHVTHTLTVTCLAWFWRSYITVGVAFSINNTKARFDFTSVAITAFTWSAREWSAFARAVYAAIIPRT